MKCPDPTTMQKLQCPGQRRLPSRSGGQLLAELGCWILGIAMILGYLAATRGLENQRTQGLAVFSEARLAQTQGLQPDGLPLALETRPKAGENEPQTVSVARQSVGVDALPIAVLRMASVDLEVPVYGDVSELNLSRGAGWIEGTAAPNTGGNLAVAAHRDQYFRPLKDVRMGDRLELESLSGPREFRVTRIRIVDPDDLSVLDDTGVPTVTLVTCYPFYFIGSAPKRYIVQATAVESPGSVAASMALSLASPSGESP